MQSRQPEQDQDAAAQVRGRMRFPVQEFTNLLQILHCLSISPCGSAPLSTEICPSGQFFQTRGACKPEDSVVEVELVRDDVMNVKDVYTSLIKLRLTETNALKVKLETGAE
jgi:hypothetical protein